ncbi:hypothetical protein ACLOJK_017390 [Asimina triloba]
MFYSQTFLAKKSPLGTIWIAAHLQHKLRKSQVVVTDIPSSVGNSSCIHLSLRFPFSFFSIKLVVHKFRAPGLNPDAAIVALDISAFASVQVNLPEDATNAPFQSITLPETFDLDALELDDMIYWTQGLDNHLKTFEEITLVEQIPAEGDPYVCFLVDEVHLLLLLFMRSLIDIPMDTSPPMDLPMDLPRDSTMMGTSPIVDLADDGARPMEEDAPPLFSRDHAAGSSLSGPVNATEESNQKLHEDNFHEDPPEIEIRRDAGPSGPGNIPDIPDFGDDTVVQDEHFDPNITQKEFLSPIMEGNSASGEESQPSRLHLMPTFRSEEEPVNLGSRLPSGPTLPELGIQPTPPARPRRRKQFIDKELVITNHVMRNQIENASSLVHKRKKGPVSTLDIWRFEKIRKMDHSILEPLLCGMSIDLREVFFRTYTASEAPSQQPQDADAPPQPRDADASPQPLDAGVPPQPRDAGSPGGIPFSEMEIEHPRFDEGHFEMPDFGPSPSRREELTPSPARDLESGSQIGKFLEIETLPTPELSVYAGAADPESENPRVASQERLPVEVTSLPDIPEILRSAEPMTPHQGEQLVGETSVPSFLDVLHSAETEVSCLLANDCELNFLEAENSTIHKGGSAESDVDTLSVRTRGYVKGHIRGKWAITIEDKRASYSDRWQQAGYYVHTRGYGWFIEDI